MSAEQKLSESADDYLEKLAEFTQIQQEKVSLLLADTQKNIAELAPSNQAKQIDSQVEALMDSVSKELGSAMVDLNKQMNLINQSTSYSWLQTATKKGKSHG